MSGDLIRNRWIAMRRAFDMTQEELAAKVGFSHRQTVAAIEAGERKISATELIEAAKVFDVDVEVFTDPFRLIVGEARFSWRESAAADADFQGFEEVAGRWIATYRELSKRKGDSTFPLLSKLNLTEDSSFEDATDAGEQLAKVVCVSGMPARDLLAYVEARLNTIVLRIDAIQGVSGAACSTSDLNVILINRKESTGRQNYNLAHELFHLLTWDTLPPCYRDGKKPASKKQRRAELLADNFAAALLMPEAIVRSKFEDLHGLSACEWLNRTANELEVSAQALKWRLVNLELLSGAAAKAIDDEQLKHNGRVAPNHAEAQFPLFGLKFMEMMEWGLREGEISVRKLSRLLSLSVDELSDVFSSHSISVPFDM